ncbi:MAG TPA: phosphatase PAP2 family protein [Terriglobia bacterium]|nr:phosphatase PAP2 family protein [Terriglobia bacterium]
MRFYELLTLGFYLSFAVLAWRRSLSAGRRAKATGIAVAGFGCIAVAAAQSQVHPIVGIAARNWLPVMLIPMAYWQTGQFVLPLNKVWQARLQRFDQKPLLARICSSVRSPSRRFLNTILELSYLFCYPLVPCGLAVLYWTGMAEFAEEFWNIVVPPAYVCYATFPFVQTLPPRAIEDSTTSRPRQTKLRTLNLFVLRQVSIQANTFPSGHVAASLAISLELIRLTPRVGIVFLCVAASIAAGAFIGRYHYALDVLAGAGLAVGSFLVVVAMAH